MHETSILARRRWDLLWLLPALAWAAASGCARPAAAVGDAPALAAAEVATVRPERATLRRTVEQPGYVEAFEETPLYAKVAGYVKRVRADIGDAVKEGDTLAELAVPELDEEFKQKQALVRQAEAEVEQAAEAVKVGAAGLEAARAAVREAEAGRTRAAADYERDRLEYRRIEGLAGRKVVDEQLRDETLRQLKSAEAARDEVEAKVLSRRAAETESAARLAKLRADLKAARARSEVSRADCQRTAALVGYTKVRAPFAGVVTRRHVHTGHFLHPPTSGGANRAEPLFVVVRTDPVRVFVNVPEADAVWVKAGAPARVRVEGLHGREFDGPVTRLSWSLSRQERTLRVEVDLPNPAEELRPGMFAHASIRVEHPGALTLPAAAVLSADAANYCYCVENGKACRTPVRVGARQGDRVEVLKKMARPAAPGREEVWKDFTGTEAVVTSNPRALADGQPVTVVPAEQ